MTLRRIIKQWLPPVVTDMIRSRLAAGAPIWEGIYQNLESVPGIKLSYDDPSEVESHLASTRSALELVQAGKKFRSHHEALGLIAGTVRAHKGSVKVLDFGGSTGLGYVHLLDTLHDISAVEYHVVDLPGMCAAGRALFREGFNVHFHTAIPEQVGDFDLVHIRSVLPYISDYGQLLQKLAAKNALYFLLPALAAGDIPTYAARQLNLANVILPYWFLNLPEVVKLMQGAGYTLQYDGLDATAYNQNNFPESHRIGRMRTVLFSRSIPKKDSSSPKNTPL